jgi:hypothetical protein
MLPHPSVLYKYLNPLGAADFLKAPQLRFRDFRELDDLMEVLPGHRPLTEAEVQRDAEERHHWLKERGKVISVEKCAIFVRALSSLKGTTWEDGMRELLVDAPGTLFICSLTERWNSGAMWGTYAERHGGIVFGISGAIDRVCQTRAYLAEVVYDEECPQMPSPVVDPGVMKQAIRTKSPDWSYQREWRLISNSNTAERLSGPEVTEIVVGYRASKEIKAAAYAFREQGTAVFQAHPDPQRHSTARRELEASDFK